jgi:uncharacterized protein YcbK (DUF882 family)
MNRRHILKFSGSALLNGILVAGGATAALMPANAIPAQAPTPQELAQTSTARQLSFVNTHTGERFNGAYWRDDAHLPDALAAINNVMRDHRTGDVYPIDPNLLDQLNTLYGLVGASQPIQIISGYRSPATNATLTARSSGVATGSLHMQGKAIDIRIAGVELTHLRDTAIGMQAGGVGYYEASNFVHVDTGRVRRW